MDPRQFDQTQDLADTISALGACKITQDIDALWKELRQVRDSTKVELARDREERLHEGGKIQSANCVLKMQVEELGKESAKQLTTIEDLCAVVNTLGMLLSREQKDTFIEAREFVVTAKLSVERVRRRGQQHKSFTSDLLTAISSLSRALPSEAAVAEDEIGRGKPLEELAEIAKEHVVGLQSRREKHRRAAEDLVACFGEVAHSLESEHLGKVPGAEPLYGTIRIFFEMQARLQQDARDGKGVEAVIETLLRGPSSSEGEVGDGAGELWLTLLRQALEEARLDCDEHTKSGEILVKAIDTMKFALSEKLQEKVLKDAVTNPCSRMDHPSSEGLLLGTSMSRPGSEPADKLFSKPSGDDTDRMAELQRALRQELELCETMEVHLVDNSVLKAPSPGLGHRNSPTLGDMDQDKAMSAWGSLVCGTSVSDEWLKVGDKYLPKKLDGVVVLRPYLDAEQSRSSSGGSSSGSSRARSKSRQPATVPTVLDPIPEDSDSRTPPRGNPEDSFEDPARGAPDPPQDAPVEIYAKSSISGILEDSASMSESLPAENVLEDANTSIEWLDKVENVLEDPENVLRSQVRDEVMAFCKELQASGGLLAPDGGLLRSRADSNEKPESIALDDRVKGYIEEVARKFVEELWQGTSRGSGKEPSSDAGTPAAGRGSLQSSPVRRGGYNQWQAAHSNASQDCRSRLAAVPLGSSRQPSASPDGSGGNVPSSPDRINMPLSMEVQRPNTWSASSRGPGDLTPGVAPISASLAVNTGPGGCSGASPGGSPGGSMAVTPGPGGSMVMTPGPGGSTDSAGGLTPAFGHPGGATVARSTSGPTMMIQSSTASPSPRGRRMSSQGTRPAVPLAGPRLSARPSTSLEALQRSGSGPVPRLSGGERTISTSPGPASMSMSPPPVGTSRQLRATPTQQAPSAHRFSSSRMPFAGGPMGVSRKTVPARASSPESLLEFDMSGRPLAGTPCVLSV